MEHDRQLLGIGVGDDPRSWAEAGFTIDGTDVVIGRTTIELLGTELGRGVRTLLVDGLPAGDIDDLTLVDGGPRRAPGPAAGHANGVTGIDHLVVLSPDVDRTTAALEDRGVAHRRSRLIPSSDGDRRQSFFWLGDVILELVGPDDRADDGPAVAWGLALTCPDLDHAAAALGERCGAVTDAVQPGRRIATLRTRELGISVPIALMSPHAGQGDAR